MNPISRPCLLGPHRADPGADAATIQVRNLPPAWQVLLLALLLGLPISSHPVRAGESPEAKAVLRIVCTTPDLESLTREIGDVRVQAFCLAKGPEDPHTLDLLPAFSRELHQADLFVQVGLGIENAWLKDLITSARNPNVAPGKPGNLNLGVGVRPLEGTAGAPQPGTFHEEGNPHYFLDPLEGLRAARVLKDRLSALRPTHAAEFNRRFEDFRFRLGSWLVGEECARHDDIEALALKLEKVSGPELQAFLTEHRLGGFLADLLPHRGKAVVGDHDLWPYLARRCGLEILGYLEPSPGVPPTTRHLGELVRQMKERGARIILSSPYFDPRPGAFVAQATGARVVEMAHQTGGREGCADYLAMLRYNGSRLLAALGNAQP